jgi:hypothetical protein
MDNPLDLDNRSQIVVYDGSSCVSINTRETRVFEAWKQMPDAILPARDVRKLTEAIYYQRLYYGDWLKPQSFGVQEGAWLPPLYDAYRIKRAKDYPLDGLTALSELFANETYDCIRFRSVTAFAKYPAGHFGINDEACTFDDWHKGYLLALMRFGDMKAGSSSSSKILAKYSGDIDFIERYTKTARTGRRDLVGVLKAFAWTWDVFSLPLRYFSGQAALDFSKEYLGYYGNDLPTFRRTFFGGGSNKDGHGLKLKSSKPFIVRQWSKDSIAISSQAAADQGFEVSSLVSMLENIDKRRVIIR